MVFPSPAPFMMMASADYSPYPMHTARDSAPVRRHTHPESPRVSRFGPNLPATSKPGPVRVDSGFDEASDTSSITFTAEVEARVAMREFMIQRYYRTESESEEEEEEQVEDVDFAVGELALRTRDSIDMIIERAGTWESKESRAKRNRKSKSSRMRRLSKWFKKLLRSRA